MNTKERRERIYRQIEEKKTAAQIAKAEGLSVGYVRKFFADYAYDNMDPIKTKVHTGEFTNGPLKDWDRIRLRLINSGKDLGRIRIVCRDGRKG